MAIQSMTKPETWPINDLVDAMSERPSRSVRVELPKFQRSVVWKKQQREELILSIHRGFPIGSLLLYERPQGGSDGMKTYLLVDGLQRATAIKAYTEEPLSFLSVDVLDDQLIRDWTQAWHKLAGAEEAPREALQAWMRQTKTLKAVDGFSDSKLASFTADLLQAETLDEYTRALSSEIIDHIKEKSDIGSVSLSTLVYQGRESNLPDIFEKVNTGGTTLTKYEIFSAAWIDQSTEVTNQLVVEAVENKYQDVIEAGMQVMGLGPSGEIEDFSLFEYLFGLGKVLTSRFPLLFPPASSRSETESVAFTLATVCHGLRIAEMKKLPEYMVRDGATNLISPTAFEEALLRSCDFVKEALEPYVGIKLNRKKPEPPIGHTEYQIASLVSRAVIGRYDRDTWEERVGWEQDWEELEKALPAHYLFDIISDNWRGSGDTRLFDRTWKVDEDDGSLEPAQHYTRRIGRKEWDRELDGWLEEQLQKTQRKRSSIRSVDKVFLAYVYSGILNYREHLRDGFEIEHVLPISRLSALILDSEEGWPLSAVGNLALFEQSLNREKSKSTVVQYLNRQSESERDARRAAIQKFLLVSPEEADIPQPNGTDELDREAYEQFVRERFARMKAIVLDGLGVPENAPG